MILRKILFIMLFCVSFLINAQENDIKDDESEQIFEEENIDYDKTGIILSLSAFNYFSMGLGFNKGD